MPFIMMCGLPSSGKTYLVAKLVEYLKNEHKKNVHVIDDAAYLSSSKNSIYQDSAKEKELRATLKSEAQKLMSKEDIVILDHMNYIKGYRYELFCISKLVQTPQCVIYCTRDLDECLELNKKRPENEQYSEEIMQALKMRFEAPDAKNRWDSTLFTISAEESDNLPLEEIANALLSQKAPPPNKSTLNKPLSDTTFLHDIDKISQDILTYILSLQTNQLAANEVSVPGATQKVKLIRPVTLAELRKWRQQFLTYVKMHPPSDAGKIPNMFVDYINNLII